MDMDVYKKLVKEFISGLQRIEDQPDKFLPLVDDSKKKFLTAFGKVTHEDVQRDIDIELLDLNSKIQTLFFAKRIRKLGGIADLTENGLALVLRNNKDDIRTVKALLKKHKLSLRRG